MNPLSKKERMKKALLRQSVDIIPTQVNYTAGMGQLLAEYFDISTAELPLQLGNHMLRVDINHPAHFSPDGKIKYDWWGVGFDTNEEGYFPAINPLKENGDLDSHPWPDPDDTQILLAAQHTIQKQGHEFFITPNLGFALFERAWALRGLDTFLVDMVDDEVYAAKLLEQITRIQLRLIHRYIELGVDGAYFGDDYGAQKNLIFSPAMWRKYIKPRLAELFSPFKERGLPILMHSDGQIQKILPDLVEIGLTTLNPVQPEVLDHTWLYENYNPQLTFYGGISTQTVLPFGTPEDVKAAVKGCIETLAPDRTGLLIAPSHRMMTDIPIANVIAMMNAFKEYC